MWHFKFLRKKHKEDFGHFFHRQLWLLYNVYNTYILKYNIHKNVKI